MEYGSSGRSSFVHISNLVVVAPAAIKPSMTYSAIFGPLLWTILVAACANLL
jgi:hypothetical protein